MRGNFGAWLINHGYSTRTVELYGGYVTRAARDLTEWRVTLARATFDHLYAWWSTLPRSSSSRNGARHALIAFYRYRGRDDGAPAHRLPRIPAPEMLPRPVDPLTYDEIRRAADRLGGIHQILGALLADTGCRIGEARRARWHQFVLRGDDPRWYIEGKGSRRRGPKERGVPVNEHLRAALTAWRAQTDSADWLFASDRSATGYVTRCTLARRLEEICLDAQVQRITPHVVRHSVATIALDATGDLRAVQEFLGHANPSTTAIYTKVNTRRLRSVSDVLEQPRREDPPNAA